LRVFLFTYLCFSNSATLPLFCSSDKKTVFYVVEYEKTCTSTEKEAENFIINALVQFFSMPCDSWSCKAHWVVIFNIGYPVQESYPCHQDGSPVHSPLDHPNTKWNRCNFPILIIRVSHSKLSLVQGKELSW